MSEQNNVSTNPSNVWQVERLISAAFNRTKERFLSYFLTLVLSFGIGILLAIGILLIVGLMFLIYGLTKSSLIVGLLSVVVGLIVLTAIYYFTSWYTLAYTTILIQEEKLGVIETFKKVRPYIWGFVWFTAIYSLFIWGLLVFGVLSLGIILILWVIWSSFSVFVYIEKRKKGLVNLWYSKALVSQRFWGIVGRLLLIYVAFYFATFLLYSSGNRVIAFSTTILSLLATPFIMSFTYEMYKQLDEPKEVKAPIVWIILSVIGWVIMIGILVFGYYTMIQTFMKLKDFNQFKQFDNLKQIDTYDQDWPLKIPSVVIPSLPDSI